MKLKEVLFVAALAAGAPAVGVAHDLPYKVVDGTKVDANTRKGFETWRGAACERCHGPNQEGMVGPSLIDSLKTLSREDFKKAVTYGRPDKGMPNFDGSKQVMDNLDNLYAYLKCRSDGACTTAKVQLAE
ncbi:MAG: cytochrome c [Burkholderiales bacterium]|jgi:mono/diheme cytochrome c family protein